MKKPLIGITAGKKSGKVTIDESYIDVIVQAGGMPLILPTLATNDVLQHMTDLCDGFLFSGGEDIYPGYYKEPVLDFCGEISFERDDMELGLMNKLKGTKKPVLGICRGLQLINVAFGGSLYQDLRIQRPDAIALEHKQKAPMNFPIHKVTILQNSKLRQILNSDTILVNSSHHQCIKELGQGLSAGAYSPCGLIEAIEDSSHPFLIGVEWHPEKMPNHITTVNIFKAFIKAC